MTLKYLYHWQASSLSGSDSFRAVLEAVKTLQAELNTDESYQEYKMQTAWYRIDVAAPKTGEVIVLLVLLCCNGRSKQIIGGGDHLLQQPPKQVLQGSLLSSNCCGGQLRGARED